LTDHPTQFKTLEQFEALELELRRLRRDNKKITRQYTFLKRLIARTNETSSSNINLSMILDAEKASREIFLDLILQNSPNIILVFDGTNRLLYGTNSFLRYLKLPHMGLITGRTLKEIFSRVLSLNEMEAFSKALAEAVSTKVPVMHQQTIAFAPKPEKPRNFIIQITPLIDNDIDFAGSLLLFHDQTEYLDARQAEAISKAKSTFMANMSHEIRTPLNTIMALSKAELQRDLSKHTRDNLTKIFSAGGTLLAIINDILDLSKVEAGHFNLVPAPYEFANLISDTISINIVRIGTKPIEFRLEMEEAIPSMFFGDELRIKQILNNLLSNAFKYTDGGHVKLSITCRIEADIAWIVFSVEDTGRGIKAANLEKIFGIYNQSDRLSNKSIEGTGLGLSICKDLVDMMHGSIAVESEFGRGSTFKAVIRQKVIDNTPIGQEVVESLKNYQFLSRRKIEQQVINRFYLPQAKVLVVDDVDTNLDVAVALLQPYGLTVDCVNSGRQALALIKSASQHYDCIFMDHMMPDMDGIEVVSKIRTEIDSDYARDVPIIAMTANAVLGSEQLFLQNGFQAFLPKPIDLNKLDLILNRWIKLRLDPENGNEESAAESGKIAPPPEPDQAAVQQEIRERLNSYYIDGLDMVAGLTRYEDKVPVYVQLLKSFIRHAPAIVDDLGNPSQESLANYGIRIHGLKGASAGICANRLAELAFELEMAAKNNDLEKVLQKNPNFISEAQALIRELVILLRTFPVDNSEDRRQIRPSPDINSLTNLMKACQTFKNSEIQKNLKDLESFSYENDGELITWLRTQADNIEYDQIYDRLSQYLSEVKETPM
jgi:signal transduction histidine kinase/CheY-like chemotaxis protein